MSFKCRKGLGVPYGIFSREFQTVGAHTLKTAESSENKFRSRNSKKIGRGGTSVTVIFFVGLDVSA